MAPSLWGVEIPASKFAKTAAGILQPHPRKSANLVKRNAGSSPYFSGSNGWLESIIIQNYKKPKTKQFNMKKIRLFRQLITLTRTTNANDLINTICKHILRNTDGITFSRDLNLYNRQVHASYWLRYLFYRRNKFICI